jgi:hypothetical protein
VQKYSVLTVLVSQCRFQFNVDDLSYEVPPSTLLSDMHSFVNNEALSDITFIIDGQPIHAHKMLLVRYVICLLDTTTLVSN